MNREHRPAVICSSVLLYRVLLEPERAADMLMLPHLVRFASISAENAQGSMTGSQPSLLLEYTAAAICPVTLLLRQPFLSSLSPSISVRAASMTGSPPEGLSVLSAIATEPIRTDIFNGLKLELSDPACVQERSGSLSYSSTFQIP
jgi:hypothetical protein